jgi:hypothetical protein
MSDADVYRLGVDSLVCSDFQVFWSRRMANHDYYIQQYFCPILNLVNSVSLIGVTLFRCCPIIVHQLPYSKFGEFC